MSFPISTTIPDTFLKLNAIAQGISIMQNPFNSTIKENLPNFQQEVINLQCNDVLNGKYEENAAEFYKFFSNDEYAQSHTCKD